MVFLARPVGSFAWADRDEARLGVRFRASFLEAARGFLSAMDESAWLALPPARLASRLRGERRKAVSPPEPRVAGLSAQMVSARPGLSTVVPRVLADEWGPQSLVLRAWSEPGLLVLQRPGRLEVEPRRGPVLALEISQSWEVPLVSGPRAEQLPALQV